MANQTGAAESVAYRNTVTRDATLLEALRSPQPIEIFKIANGIRIEILVIKAEIWSLKLALKANKSKGAPQ